MKKFIFKTRNLISIYLQNILRNIVIKKQKHTHQFLELFCKYHNLNDLVCAIIIIAHHKLDDQTYAIKRVNIYRQSLIS